MAMERIGETKRGEAVHRITLSDGVLRASFLTLGSILNDLRLEEAPDRPLTVGSPDLGAYDAGPLSSAGAIVGPVANRIGGARCSFDGEDLTFEVNGAGGHHLHSGAEGVHRRVWEVTDHGPDHVTLETELSAGAAGLPGNRRIRASWRLNGSALLLDLTAETDAPTLMNLANHSYWTLGVPLDSLSLKILADRFLPVDDTALATGEIRSVDGTRYDFRTGRKLTPEDVLDNNFCLAEESRLLTPVCRVVAPDGLALDLETTAPGLQAFTADTFGATGVRDHEGNEVGRRFGLALEPQYWPDAPNHDDFPSIRLGTGTTWRQETVWRIASA